MASTINPQEAKHFGSLAGDWWNPEGSSAMLHKLGPVRLAYIRGRIDDHFGCDPAGFRPLEGKRVLDIGCGAGLMSEPLSRLGATVTGVDAAPENIDAARAHASQSGLAIDYRAGDFRDMDIGGFDLIVALEVIEHVSDPQDFLDQLAGRLVAGGLMILSTPNRTLASRLLLVEAAEALGQIPRGTHHWEQFVTPPEMEAMAGRCNLKVIDQKGIGFSPARGLTLTDDLGLNYVMTFTESA